jgi:riboflavin kinase/FMN adenylyltransferase
MPEHVSALPHSARGTVITVGTFDGVHRGHAHVLERTANAARDAELASVALTFDPHPLDVVNPSAAPPLLMLWDEKVEVLAQTSIDYVVVLPFTADLARLAPEEFVDRVLLERFDMRALYLGHDHGFGRGRTGDVESLRMIGQRRGFPVEAIDAVLASDGTPISSTAVRRAIAHGDLARAQDGLGRRYAFSGRVSAGEGRGRLLGFPTLNVALASRRKLLPPHGVYAVIVSGVRGTFGGMMNLGPRPTFGDEAISLEVHVFDAAGDWYGDAVKVEFVARLRDTIKFSGPDALVAQLRIDAEQARALVQSARIH